MDGIPYDKLSKGSSIELDLNVSSWIKSWIDLSYSPSLIEYVLYSKEKRKAVPWLDFCSYKSQLRLDTGNPEDTKIPKSTPFYYPKRVAFTGDLICYNSASLCF
jgi:hypothetical protein